MIAPQGYYFDKLRDDEAELIDNAYKYKDSYSLECIRRRIKYFPNVCLRSGDNGELASFEILEDDLGFMNHLYTFPKFRRQGLALKYGIYFKDWELKSGIDENDIGNEHSASTNKKTNAKIEISSPFFLKWNQKSKNENGNKTKKIY